MGHDLDTLKLHADLEDARAKLVTALKKAMPVTWDETVAFAPAYQPEAIGKVLIGELHSHLANAKIRWIFRQNMGRGEVTKLATMRKMGAKMRFLSEIDFVCDVNWSAYRLLSPEQKIALVDHELMHAGRDMERQAFVMVPHDVEEFEAIIYRHGLWKADLRPMARTMKRQLELFTQEEADEKEIAQNEAEAAQRLELM